MVQRFYFQQGVGYLEGEGDRTEFQYDYNSVEPTSAQNVAGRLALTKSTFGGVGGGNTVYEMFLRFRVVKQRLRISKYPLCSTMEKDIEYWWYASSKREVAATIWRTTTC